MREFFSKHQYLIIWICGLIIVGSLAVLIVQLNSSFLPTGSYVPQPSAPVINIPAAPLPPSVTLTIEKNGKQNTLQLHWQNLPANTTMLYIFRGKGSNTSTWMLWREISIGPGQLNGDATFNLKASDLGYQYYVQAINNNGSGNSTSSEDLWTSGTTDPGTSSSTDQGTGGNDNNGGNGNTTSTNGQGNSTSTQGTNGNGNSSSSNNGGNGNGNGSSTNSDTYYNPQVQVTGYGTAKGDFWVQHENQTIEMGWQNLPANTDDIIFYRSTDQSQWNQLLEQKDPGSTGSYSLQLVDGTLNDPYYYEMVALQGSTASATYGPIYLPPAGQ